MEPPLEPPPPPERAYVYSTAHPQEARRPRWYRVVEVTTVVVAGVALTALAIGGLAILGVWIILIVGMNNVGSNK